MTATLVGEVTIGACVPGISAALAATGAALNSLHGSVSLAVDALVAIGDIDLSAELGSINAGVGAQLQAQIDGGVSARASLDLVVDAGAWLADIVASLSATIALLGTLDADVHLGNVKLSVDAGIDASIAAKASLDADLNALAAVSIPLPSIIADLNVALSAALPGLIAYAELTSQLLSAGVVVAHFTGQVQDFGTDCDAAIAGSSLGPTDNSTGVALLVSASNPTTTANFKAVFGIT